MQQQPYKFFEFISTKMTKEKIEEVLDNLYSEGTYTKEKILRITNNILRSGDIGCVDIITFARMSGTENFINDFISKEDLDFWSGRINEFYGDKIQKRILNSSIQKSDNAYRFLYSQMAIGKTPEVLLKLTSVLKPFVEHQNKIGKNVWEFTITDFLDVFSGLSIISSGTFQATKSLMLNYLEYCVSEGLNNGDIVSIFKTLKFNQIDNKGIKQATWFKSEEEFLNAITNGTKGFTYSTGEAGLMLAWVGLSIKEVITLRRSQINIEKGYISTDFTKYSLSDNLKRYVDNLLEERISEIRKKITNTVGIDVSFDNMYVLLNGNGDVLTENVFTQTVGKTILSLGWKKKGRQTKFTGVQDSGRYYKLYLFEKEFGEEIQMANSDVREFIKTLYGLQDKDISIMYKRIEGYNDWKQTFDLT